MLHKLRNIQFFCYLLFLVCQANFPVQISKIIRSKASSLYLSESDFVESIRAHTRNENRISTELPWVIQLNANCNHHCHESIIEAYSEGKYEILDSHHAILTSTKLDLRKLLTPTHSTSPLHTTLMSSPLITDYALLHPNLKISSELFDIFHSSDYEKLLKMEIRVVLNGLTRERFDDCVTRLRSLLNDKTLLEISYPEGEEEVIAKEQRLYGVLAVQDMTSGWEMLQRLGQDTDVRWMERAYEVRTHNKWAKGVCDTGNPYDTPLTSSATNMSGAGEIIGIADTGLDIYNCYFYDPNTKIAYQTNGSTTVLNANHRKIVQYVVASGIGDHLDSTEGHGTHVAGIVSGLSYLNYGDYADYNGQNIGTKVAFYDLMIGDSGGVSGPSAALKLPGDLNTLLLQWLYRSGARVFSMSWGTNSNNYDSLAQQVDTFLAGCPDCMVFFSAGNNGVSGGSYSVGSPSTNKNGVSVGASLNDHASWVAIGNYGTSGLYSSGNMAAFSSRGPTADNRLKPDLLAPGYFVYSARGQYRAAGYHCDIQGLSGTSMAAPNAAAMALKVRQYFLQGYYPTGSRTAHHAFTPSGALLKAVLIHSGQRVSYLIGSDSGAATPLTTYPSPAQGYGRITLKSVLHFAKAPFNETSSAFNRSSARSYGHDSRHPLTLFVLGNVQADSAQGNYAAFTAAGQSHVYNFSTSTSSASQPVIRITMTFTDFAGSAMATSAMLNDLSVSATNALGQVFVPYLPSGIIRSNVQVIDITTPFPATTYFVTITCNTLTRSPQPYALVMTGYIQYLSSHTSTSSTSTAEVSYTRVNYFTTWTMTILYTLAAFAAGCFLLLVWIIRLTSKKELSKLHQQLATYLKAKNVSQKRSNKVGNDSAA